jgi:hypothetical protein
VRRLLEDLGSLEPPPPDPDFIDRLEFQLRAETIALAPDTTYDDAPWRVPFGIAAAAFTVVAGVAGITVVRDMPESHVSAHLVAATNVRVTLPNGEEYDAEPGMVIPKGAIVEVFSGGEAEINGMKFAAGSKVVVTDDGVRPVDGDDLLQFDDEQLAGPGRDSSGGSGTRVDSSEPAVGDGLTPGLPTADGSAPLRQAERAVKSRGFEAVRRTTGDTAPPQTSVADPAPSVDYEAPSTDQAAPPSIATPETTAPESTPPPESVPPTTEAPAPSTPPTTEAPAPSTPPTTEVPAPTTPPTTTPPPTTVPEPTPPTTPLDPTGPEAPPSGTTTTTTPDVDPAGEDGGEVTPPDGNGKGDEGGGLPTGDDAAAEAQPETSDDLASGDEETAAGADAGTDGSGSGTDETAAADTVAAE